MKTEKKKHYKKYPWVDNKITRISMEAERLLGWPGRRLYPSKGMKKPTTIFNANIFNSKANKIWFGDIEIERDKETLLRLSKKSGPIYILYEMDERFLEEILSVAYVKTRAAVRIDKGNISYGENFARYIENLSKRMKGKIRNKAKRGKDGI